MTVAGPTATSDTAGQCLDRGQGRDGRAVKPWDEDGGSHTLRPYKKEYKIIHDS
jgi:hypothetical protein